MESNESTYIRSQGIIFWQLFYKLKNIQLFENTIPQMFLYERWKPPQV